MTANDMAFSYFIGEESEQFSFVKVPKLFFTDERFSDLSYGSKILYGLLLDRMSLSRKNQWLDEKRRVYVIYTIESIREDFKISKTVAVRFMKELEDFGLIERKRRPNAAAYIYVKNFVLQEDKDKKTIRDSGSPEVQDVEVQNLEVQKMDFLKKAEIQGSPKSGLPENRLPEVQNMDSNKTNINKTDINIPSSSYCYNRSREPDDDKELKNRIGYCSAGKFYRQELVNTVYGILVKQERPETLPAGILETICKNITEYAGSISNLSGYIQKCIDNMLITENVLGAKNNPVKGTESSRFGFVQNQYDFKKLEDELTGLSAGG